MLDFDVVIEKGGKTGQVYASVPSLPGCYSYADTIGELLKNIKEAIELQVGAKVLFRQKTMPHTQLLTAYSE